MDVKIIPFLLAGFSAVMLCGCENANESVPTEPSAFVSETTAALSVTEVSYSISGRTAVTFASAETETERTASKSEEWETVRAEQLAEKQLAENQLDCIGENFYLLMEFTGAEPIEYYPRAVLPSKYRGDEYVLHSKFTITNLSEKSFDFIPQKIVIYGRNKNNRNAMMPISERDTGLVASDGYYTVDAGDTVSFDVDFVGKEVCIDYACKILYNADGIREPNNVDSEQLNNVSAAEFEITKRNKVKNAVRAARNFGEAKKSVPDELVPAEGEYSVLTHKNSYCFTAEPVNDGRYIKIAVRIQCLTGKPEIFDPRKFRLYISADEYDDVYAWSFDPLLAKMFSSNADKTITLVGVDGSFYDTPWELYVRADGTAEYTMYFVNSYDGAEYYKFCYDGENDVFECMINL